MSEESRDRFYGPGSRELQERYDSRRLADRLVDVTLNDRLDENLRALIARQSLFFLATVGADGFPDVSYKGGEPGFIRTPDEHTILFPSYDGNGQFRSLGNILGHPQVSLLFVEFGASPNRYRVQGTAVVHTDGEIVESFRGAEAVVEVTVTRTFPNCPRYVHDLEAGTLHPAGPVEGREPEEAEWKSLPFFTDVLPGSSSPSDFQE